MQLKKLKLNDFRNYSVFEQKFDDLKTIIIGPNAQGKTNILEAINILATADSTRAERDSNLILWNKDFAIIFAEIESKEGKLEIALQINKAGKRRLKINGIAKRAPHADLIGNFFVVMFSCDDLYLIKGSPSLRRSWIDSVSSQLNTSYHKCLQDYQKSVTQKNSLLKKAQEGGISRKDLKEQVEIWNEQIISSGSEILVKRIDFLEKIKPIAKDFLSEMSNKSEELGIKYISTITQTELELDISLFKATFRKSLDEHFNEETARGQSIIGPHRDDISFTINDKEIKSFGSQGQQRSTILSIKLAEVKIIEDLKGEIPVLLLDDVFAELDENRQDFLLKHLPSNIQTFLTTTHLSNIQKQFLNNSRLIEISNGNVLEKQRT